MPVGHSLRLFEQEGKWEKTEEKTKRDVDRDYSLSFLQAFPPVNWIREEEPLAGWNMPSESARGPGRVGDSASQKSQNILETTAVQLGDTTIMDGSEGPDCVPMLSVEFRIADRLAALTGLPRIAKDPYIRPATFKVTTATRFHEHFTLRSPRLPCDIEALCDNKESEKDVPATLDTARKVAILGTRPTPQAPDSRRCGRSVAQGKRGGYSTPSQAGVCAWDDGGRGSLSSTTSASARDTPPSHPPPTLKLTMVVHPRQSFSPTARDLMCTRWMSAEGSSRYDSRYDY
ncbi:hypothetical protein EI94DRAFT_1789005 [Lactarius quietus]|nr:hypothetical protein EI94DRAFT_1789005 [Lactarius quietus]